MKKKERGTSDEVVSPDSTTVLVKWFDNKPIMLLSTAVGVNPEGTCRRWSKASQSRLTIKCPAAVITYNQKMGGVDMHDRMLSYYRSKTRTKKWTIRTILHFVDVAVVNSWIQYRKDRRALADNAKDIKQLMDFKMDIADAWLSTPPHKSDESESDDDNQPGPSAKRMCHPMPSEHRRYSGTKHLPDMVEGLAFSNRCRREGCSGRTTVRCDTCDVFLCITKKNNCFRAFHLK
jgi:hypothetical protein